MSGRAEGGDPYSYQPTPLTPPLTLAIGRDALTISGGKGAADRVAWRDVREVRLTYAPRQFQANRHVLRLTVEGGRPVVVTNMSVRGIGRFDDRSADFAPFVEALHRMLAARGRGVAYHGGLTPAMWAVNAVVTALLLAMLIAGGLWFALSGALLFGLLGIAVGIVYLPGRIRFLKDNRPQGYDPLAIPAALLPRS